MVKWLLAYVITLMLFPRVKPYVKDIIDNEYVLDVVLGIAIFVIVIFLCAEVIFRFQNAYVSNGYAVIKTYLFIAIRFLIQ